MWSGDSAVHRSVHRYVWDLPVLCWRRLLASLRGTISSAPSVCLLAAVPPWRSRYQGYDEISLESFARWAPHQGKNWGAAGSRHHVRFRTGLHDRRRRFDHNFHRRHDNHYADRIRNHNHIPFVCHRTVLVDMAPNGQWLDPGRHPKANERGVPPFWSSLGACWTVCVSRRGGGRASLQVCGRAQQTIA